MRSGSRYATYMPEAVGGTWAALLTGHRRQRRPGREPRHCERLAQQLPAVIGVDNLRNRNPVRDQSHQRRHDGIRVPARYRRNTNDFPPVRTQHVSLLGITCLCNPKQHAGPPTGHSPLFWPRGGQRASRVWDPSHDGVGIATRCAAATRHRPRRRLPHKATRPAGDTVSAETNLLRELHWSPTALGIVMGAGGAGGILGALVWQPLERRWGPGPVMLGALSLNPLAQIPLVLVGPGLGGQIAVGIGMVIQTGAAVCHGGLQRAVRQELAPDELQGRAQATGAWLAFSLRPFAALAAGGLGTWLGLHLTLTLITVALVIPFLVLWNSPVRDMRTVAPAALTVTEEPANP